MSGTNLEGERDGVDGDDLAAREVLQRACEEGLWEEEAGDPVDSRHALLDPVVDELHALHEVEHPGSQWLERRVRLARPHRRNLVVEETVRHVLERLRHHHQTLERLL